MSIDSFALSYSALGRRIQKLEPKMTKNHHFGYVREIFSLSVISSNTVI